jgi:hypothetical protein
LPRFTIFLMTEIRAKVKTGEPKARQAAGLSFWFAQSAVRRGLGLDRDALGCGFSCFRALQNKGSRPGIETRLGRVG